MNSQFGWSPNRRGQRESTVYRCHALLWHCSVHYQQAISWCTIIETTVGASTINLFMFYCMITTDCNSCVKSTFRQHAFTWGVTYFKWSSMCSIWRCWSRRLQWWWLLCAEVQHRRYWGDFVGLVPLRIFARNWSNSPGQTLFALFIFFRWRGKSWGVVHMPIASRVSCISE